MTHVDTHDITMAKIRHKIKAEKRKLNKRLKSKLQIDAQF